VNLQFLLTSSPETLREWFDQVDIDDVEYAMEIMAKYSEELVLRQRFIDVENTAVDVIEANNYLSKFRLNK
jgi:hypothetical protein